MGGGDSREVVVHHHHTNTVYQVPPETQKKLNDAIATVQILEAEAVKREDPKYFVENSVIAMDKFVETVKTLNLKEYIAKAAGERHIGFIGNISAGKTSLLNELYGLNEAVALDHTTEGCKIVHVANNTHYWDVAGSNDDYKFYNAESLAFVKSLDLVVIVFDNDIAMITNFIKVVNAINPNIIVVRTKCDNASVKNTKSLAQVKAADIAKLEALIGDPRVYHVSAHNVHHGCEETYDWFTLRAVL